MNLAMLLQRSARTRGASHAIFSGERPALTYGEFEHRVSRLAAALAVRFGLRPGDRVAICMKNCPEYLEVLFAAWWAGLVAVPISAKLHPREVLFILQDSGADLCFCPRDFAVLLRESEADAKLPRLIDIRTIGREDYEGLEPASPREVGPADTAWLFYTSGTTGKPKGAQLSHRNLRTMILGYLADVDSISPEDCWLVAAPLSHGCGLYALPFIARGAALVITESGSFNPDEVIRLGNAFPRISSFFVPTMITKLIDDPAISELYTENLKTIVYGGGPMYTQECLRALEALGPHLAQIYGQGETPMTITALTKRDHADASHPDYLERLGSVGRAQLAVDVDVVDGNGRSVAVGEVGEVVVRGDTVMSGYWQNPAATAAALKGGWLHTGDLGVFNADGYLTLKDRSKDLIISGGSNIYPREVEEVLLRHPLVREAAVIGRKHMAWGEEVVAIIVSGAVDVEPLTAELDQLCRDNLARFKRPREYFFEAELPKNAIGKVMKSVLREKLT